MILKDSELSYLKRYNYSFQVPRDLSLLTSEQLFELLGPVEKDIGYCINGEPTWECYMAEDVYALVQEAKPEITKKLF